jgi:phage gp37-like protein
MGVIATVEDALLAEVVATFGATLRHQDSLPGGWTLDTLKRALQLSPGVYVAFTGLTPGGNEGYHNGRFSVYAVTKGASDTTRRRGTARVLGAYDILEQLLPRLDGLLVPDVATARVSGVDNLFRDAMFDLGGAVYAIQLTVPNMPLDYQVDESTLDDFVTFDAVHDLDTDQTGEPEANDHLTGLDQL